MKSVREGKKIDLHCRTCDFWWEISSLRELSRNIRCPKCKSTKIYGDEKSRLPSS